VIRQVRSPAEVAREHLQALHTGSEVTRWFRKEREPNVLHVTPERVVAALHRAGINPVLMGTHGLNGYRDQARATDDVDVLVTKKHVRKAVRVLETTFPYLEVIENAAVARFLNPATQKVVIDVMKPTSRAMQIVFRHTTPIGKTHRIPDLEMALVSKFVAMVSPNRSKARKVQDAADFAAIVSHNKETVDLERLRRLAANVYPARGAEIVKLAQDMWAGRTLEL
jgi:hypothetical protein